MALFILTDNYSCCCAGKITTALYENLLMQYYTITDFNEVDIRIYLPDKNYIHRGRKAEVNITSEGR